MIKNKTANVLLLFLAALIWGIAFVAQSDGGAIVGPFTFNSIRLLLTALVLRIIITITDKTGLSKAPVQTADKKRQFIVGIVCGAFLFVATNFQQIGINLGASAGKAGFLTSVYIILVPIIGLFFKKKCNWTVWVAVVIALIGLYFLCVKGEFVLSTPDILLLLCALGFAGQIVTIDLYVSKVDPLRLSGMQFLFAGFVSLILAIVFEAIPYDGGFSAWAMSLLNGRLWIDFLFMGIFSGGIAYTLQIICQKNLDPTLASLVMSFESVFSALSGWIILHQSLTIKEVIGCIIMFVAVIIAQLDFSRIKNK